MRTRSILVFAVVSVATTRLLVTDDATQRLVESVPWAWSDEEATPLFGLSQAGSRYEVTLRSKPADRFALRFDIADGDKDVYTWVGHRYSVFRILGDRLIYIEFDPATSGGTVINVDLRTGREVWRSKLRALGEVAHFAYRSRMRIEVNDSVALIFGNESKGKYIEAKDIRSGQTCGLKVVDIRK